MKETREIDHCLPSFELAQCRKVNQESRFKSKERKVGRLNVMNLRKDHFYALIAL